MNILRNDIDAVNAIITLQVAKADYAEKVEKTLKDYRKKVNIPGFRTGMAPMGIVKKMYGKGVMADEVNKLLQETIYEYIRENNIDVLGEPLPNETEQAQIDFDIDEDFEFKFDIAIAPEFEPSLNKRDNLKYYEVAITEEMISAQVSNYASRFGSYTEVTKASDKDVLKGTITQVGARGKVVENGITAEDAVLSPAYMKDEKQKALFADAAIGDVITFDPKKAYENETEISTLLKITKEEVAELKGKFSFEIKSITHYEEATVDQTLFDKVFGEGNVKTEEEFRTRVSEGIRNNFNQDSDYKFGIDAKALIVKKMDKLVFPNDFLKRWVLATNEKMTAEEVDTNFDAMLDDLKWYIAKNKIAKANELTVAKEDVDNYARKMASIQFAQYGMNDVPEDILMNYAQDMMKKEETVRNIAERALEDKVYEVVKNTIKVTTQEVSTEEFNQLFQ